MDFGSILGGMAQGANSDIQARRNVALGLKMRSLLAQQQLQNQMSLMQKQQDFNTLPPDVADRAFGMAAQNKAGVLNSLFPGANVQPLDLSGMGTPAGQRAAMGLLNSQSAPVSLMRGTGSIATSNGQTIYVQRDARGNLVGTTPLGTAEGVYNKIKGAEAAYGAGHADLSRLYNQMKSFITAQDASGIPGQWTKLKLNNLIQSDPQAAAYFKQLTLNALTQDKQLTGTSRQAENVVGGSLLALPQPTDTLPTALYKLQNLDSRWRHVMDANYAAFGVAPKNQTYPNTGLIGDQDLLKQAHEAGIQKGQQAAGVHAQALQKLEALIQAQTGNAK